MRVKNRMRVIRSSGSVRGGDGDIPAYSARRFADRARTSASQVELVVSVIGVSLQDTGISGQMPLRMLAFAISRVVKYCRGRPGSAKRPVIAKINPAPPGVGFALGQNRHRRIIPMQALGRHDMGFY